MKQPVKAKVIKLITILAGLFTTYISCNKINSPRITTVIKCVTCDNGGQCINDTCRCPTGWEGTGCETMVIQKFLGEWSVTEKGSSSPNQNYIIEIDGNSGYLTSVTIFNLFNNASIMLQANVSGDTLYIPIQTIDGHMFVGIGYIHSNPVFITDGKITMRYMVTNTVTGAINDFGYSSSTDSSSQWVKD